MCILLKGKNWYEHDQFLFPSKYRYYNRQCIHENNHITVLVGKVLLNTLYIFVC